jgi:hypothetical protein
VPGPCAKTKTKVIEEKDLSNFRLVEDFARRLETFEGKAVGTFADPRRLLGQGDYLSLLLFGLLNPVLDSMRGLCAASSLGRLRDDLGVRRVSLGSFSEFQAVIDPSLLEKVLAGLVEEQRRVSRADSALKPRDQSLLMAVDSTVWKVLPRMAWAYWRHQNGAQNAVRLHVKFNVHDDAAVEATLAGAKSCERAVLLQSAKAGEFYVGDRYYGANLGGFEALRARGCAFIFRLQDDVIFESAAPEYELSAADRAAGVVFDGRVHLGRGKKHPPVRLVRIVIDGGDLLLVTTQKPEDFSAELVAATYRKRWQIEMFFKWLKCILGCRHWFAESERGVRVQIYCALIAALLLARSVGRRPGKRIMEMLAFYMSGYASLEELMAAIESEENRRQKTRA